MDDSAASPATPDGDRAPASSGARHSFLVASGIFFSRILGLVRTRLLAHFLGSSDAADAFNAAFKIPNFLQNLLGEGVLSASFIPVYARKLAEGERESAERIAGAVLSLLCLVASVLVLVGILLTPLLIVVIAPGFDGPKRDLTITLVRIFFPGMGLFVLSAWCLGILNSHRRFFLAYAAPVAWNLAIIVSLVGFGTGRGQDDVAIIAAWASVVGSGLQVLVQLPLVLKLLGRMRLGLGLRLEGVRAVVRSFGPVVVGRGVAQVSAYVDTLLASLLTTGAVAILGYAQVLYTLPVSLFGMAVSAAELPAMASVTGGDETVARLLRERLDQGLARIAFLVIPSAAAFILLGDVVAGTIFQTGRFGRAEAVWTWGVLAGSSVGLLAATLGRLYASAFYALRDTRTPLNFAVLRVVLTTALGYVAAIVLPPVLHVDGKWGVAGLTASAGVAAWIEFVLLRRSLGARIGRTGVSLRLLLACWASALAAAAAAWSVKLALGTERPFVLGVVALALYGVVYFALTALLGVSQSREALTRVRRLVRSR